jgi:hypothetical protein
MRLRHAGQLYDGAQSSYCWPDFRADDGSVVAVCADKLSGEGLGAAIPVGPGDSVTVEIDSDVPPQELSAAIYESDSGAEARLASLGPSASAELPTDLPAGVYDVRLFGRWADGDLTYEFKIEVASGPSAAAAVLTDGLCLPATPLTVSVGDSWTTSGLVQVPEGFPGELPEGAAEMSTAFTVSAIETATYSAGRGSARIEHPRVLAQLTTSVRDADGNVLSTEEDSGSSTPASVGNLGPVLTLDWACHRESWLQSWSEGGVASVSERTLSSGVTAVVFSVEQPFVIPAQGIDATLERHHGYDKATGRVVLQEFRTVGTLKGQPFTMEMLQELVTAGQ